MKRIPSLDGLRAISITLVMLSHLVKWKHVSAAPLQAYGQLGVHVFFVLSGFLITKLLLEERDRSSTISLRNFYLRRALRIFPAAYFFLAVVIGIYWREMHWTHIAAAVLYVSNMDVSRPWMFGHLWSLGIEEQFYLLWPFALKKWYSKRTAILLGAFLLTPVFRALLYAMKDGGTWSNSLPASADKLAIGCLLAIFAERLPRIPAYLALLMTAIAVLFPWYAANSAGRTLFMLFVLQPLVHVSIAGVVLHVVQVPYRALNWQPVAWLGKVSYSLYLWQELFCSNPSLPYGYILMLPALACACVSYYFIERPALRLRDGLSRERERAPALDFASKVVSE